MKRLAFPFLPFPNLPTVVSLYTLQVGLNTQYQDRPKAALPFISQARHIAQATHGQPRHICGVALVGPWTSKSRLFSPLNIHFLHEKMEERLAEAPHDPELSTTPLVKCPDPDKRVFNTQYNTWPPGAPRYGMYYTRIRPCIIQSLNTSFKVRH
jgi:hypothetical protein